MTTKIGFEIKVVRGNITKIKADVLVLKYAQTWSFLGTTVASKLSPESPLLKHPPRPGKWLLGPSEGTVAAPQILVIGTLPRKQFTYDSMHDMSRLTLQALAEVEKTQPIRTIAVTMHGAGWGFDEAEAFRATLLGFQAAVEDGTYPRGLQRISVVEIKPNRAELLERTLQEFLSSEVHVETETRSLGPGGGLARSAPLTLTLDTQLVIPEPIPSLDEPSVFVAMPFARKFNDIYYLAILPAVKENSCQCIRLDLSAYTGDIIETIKERIKSARIVIALLDTNNPNVFLEVGYAWGVGTPTVLVINEEQAKADGGIPFDIRSSKTLRYELIYELKTKLTDELRGILKVLDQQRPKQRSTPRS